MNNHKALVPLSLFVLASIVIPFQSCFSTVDYTRSYYLNAGGVKYELTLTVSESLYNAYKTKSHDLTLDYDKFVTPQVFVQVANQIKGLFTDDEDFANAILMIVHQIPYEVGPLKYPVETIVDNLGDCDTFSVLAASLMKAGGLDVILLKYSDHANLGVHLPHVPSDARGYVHYCEYDNKRFYIAETTCGDDWESGWRVGESPGYIRASIFPLENCETSSPGQVTATLSKLTSSSTEPGLSAPLIGYEPPPIAFATAAGSGLFYGFLRLHRRKKTEKVGPTNVTATTGVDSQVLQNWKVKQVCPKCGAWISTDNIEYCVCGEKLEKKRTSTLKLHD